MIRFYINGTAGQKDGTEVTSINPITATGLFPSGSTEATKKDVKKWLIIYTGIFMAA